MTDISAAKCVHHPERGAAMTCARCGTFVCAGCVVSGDVCVPCKSRLMKAGVPWSDAEKARKAARKARRAGTWAVRGVFSFAAAAVLLVAGAQTGALPLVAGSVAIGMGAVSAVLGAVAVGCAARGWRRSEAGRPGPAVDGVFPAPAAALMALVGAAPVALLAYLLAAQ